MQTAISPMLYVATNSCGHFHHNLHTLLCGLIANTLRLITTVDQLDPCTLMKLPGQIRLSRVTVFSVNEVLITENEFIESMTNNLKKVKNKQKKKKKKKKKAQKKTHKKTKQKNIYVHFI